MKTSHYRPNLCAKGWITPTSTTPERAGTVVRRRDRPRGGGDARRAEGGCVYDCRAGRVGERPTHRDAARSLRAELANLRQHSHPSARPLAHAATSRAPVVP